MLYGILLSYKVPKIRVVDRHRVDADQGPDPDPTFRYDAGPNPFPGPGSYDGKSNNFGTLIHSIAS